MSVIHTCAFFIAMATTIAAVFSLRGDCLACHESASASGGMFVHVEGIVLVLACCSSRVPEWDSTDVLKQDDTRCCCLTS